MPEQLYALNDNQWSRLNKLVREYEGGAFRPHAPTHWKAKKPPLESYMGRTIYTIPGATSTECGVGTVELYTVTPTSSLSPYDFVPEDTGLPPWNPNVVTAINLSSIPIPGGEYVGLIRDPFSGNYVVINLGGNAWVGVSEQYPYTIYLGRQIVVALTLGSVYATPIPGYFVNKNDVGAIIQGGGIPQAPPTFTTIASTDGNIITMTNAATMTVDVTVNIIYGTVQGYPATSFTYLPKTDGYGNSASCWLLTMNSPDPNKSGTQYPHNIFPLYNYYPPVTPILCTQVSADYLGTPIYLWNYDPAVFFDTVTANAPGYMAGLGVTKYGTLSGGTITCGNGSIMLGNPSDNGAASGSDLYVAPGSYATGVGVAGIPYMGDSGQDSCGNQFVNGINVSIGANTGGGSDYGGW